MAGQDFDGQKFFPEKEEGVGEKNKVSVQMQSKDLFLVSSSISPFQLENCEQVILDSLKDEVKFNDERLKEEDTCGGYISATQSGGGAKSRSKKQPAKAAGRRQSTLQLSLPSRGGSSNRGPFRSPVKKGKFVSRGSGGQLAIYIVFVSRLNCS